MGKKTTCAARFLFYTEVQPVLLLFSRPRELKSEASAAVFLAAVALSTTFAPDFFLRKCTHEGLTLGNLLFAAAKLSFGGSKLWFGGSKR